VGDNQDGKDGLEKKVKRQDVGFKSASATAGGGRVDGGVGEGQRAERLCRPGRSRNRGPKGNFMSQERVNQKPKQEQRGEKSARPRLKGGGQKKTLGRSSAEPPWKNDSGWKRTSSKQKCWDGKPSCEVGGTS